MAVTLETRKNRRLVVYAAIFAALLAVRLVVLLKQVGYLCVLIGLLVSMYSIFKQAEQAATELAQANEAMHREIAERMRAEAAEHEQRQLAEALREVGIVLGTTSSARQTMEMLLLKEGYELVLAEDGPEALMELDDEAAVVILLDVMMPGMDGFELCRRLKTNANWRHIPVILVTALDSKQDLARGLDAGADYFVHKPVNGLELHARALNVAHQEIF